MEYKEIFSLENDMFTHVAVEVVNDFWRLSDVYKGVEIRIKNLQNKTIVDGENVETIIITGSFERGAEVEVLAKGNIPKANLEECVKDIRKAFHFKKKDKTITELAEARDKNDYFPVY